MSMSGRGCAFFLYLRSTEYGRTLLKLADPDHDSLVSERFQSASGLRSVGSDTTGDLALITRERCYARILKAKPLMRRKQKKKLLQCHPESARPSAGSARTYLVSPARPVPVHRHRSDPPSVSTSQVAACVAEGASVSGRRVDPSGISWCTAKPKRLGKRQDASCCVLQWLLYQIMYWSPQIYINQKLKI